MPDSHETTVPLTVRVSPEMRDQLKAMADADRRPLSNFVRLILENYVQERAKQAGKADSEKPPR